MHVCVVCSLLLLFDSSSLGRLIEFGGPAYCAQCGSEVAAALLAVQSAPGEHTRTVDNATSALGRVLRAVPPASLVPFDAVVGAFLSHIPLTADDEELPNVYATLFHLLQHHADVALPYTERIAAAAFADLARGVLAGQTQATLGDALRQLYAARRDDVERALATIEGNRQAQLRSALQGS